MSRPHQLLRVDLGDGPDAWRSAGFAVDDDGVVVLGATELHCTGSGPALGGWRLDGVDDDVDGVPTAPVPRTPGRTPAGGPGAVAHPNGIVRIDHVVVRTDDVDRTVDALRRAGPELRGRRTGEVAGVPVRQAFCWAGDVVVEVVGPVERPDGAAGPARLWGLALVAGDLDATAAALGPLLGPSRDAVQPGRRIAALRGRDVGLAVPVAVMSPHPG